MPKLVPVVVYSSNSPTGSSTEQSGGGGGGKGVAGGNGGGGGGGGEGDGDEDGSNGGGDGDGGNPTDGEHVEEVCEEGCDTKDADIFKRDDNGGSCGSNGQCGGDPAPCTPTAPAHGTPPRAPPPPPIPAPRAPMPNPRTPLAPAPPRAPRPRSPARAPKAPVMGAPARAPPARDQPALVPSAGAHDAVDGVDGTNDATDGGFDGGSIGGAGCGSDSSEECDISSPGDVEPSEGGHGGEVTEGEVDIHLSPGRNTPAAAPVRPHVAAPSPRHRISNTIPRAPPPAPRSPARRPAAPSAPPRRPAPPPVVPKAPKPKAPIPPPPPPPAPKPSPKAPAPEPETPSRDKECGENGENGGTSNGCDAPTNDNGFADEPCEICPRLFIAQPMQVCGTDGQTYRSSCDLRHSACVRKDHRLKQIRNGPC
ncbi:skin secretory protein xP2-like [Lytechinus pictus]|uniref:skin secretory protein xP2-like n=1 Tax=Lytechinus pictus TaxID=7653 RepID=UPI0030B9BA21